jgi:hypothetical protein
MEFACPACGKTNDLRTAAACSRCACDLTALAAIIGGAIWHLKAAAREIRAKEWRAALAHAERSWALRHSPRAAQLACLASLALREGGEALRWRGRASGQGTSTVGS